MNRHLLVTACFGFVVIGLVNSLLGPALPGLSARFELNHTNAGALFSFFAAGDILGVFVGGVLGDRFGKGSVLRFAGVLLGVGLAIFAVAPSLWIGRAALFLYGMGFATIDGLTAAVISDAAGEHRARWLSLLNVFFGVGALCGPWLFSPMVTETLWLRFGFAVAALLAFAFAGFFPAQQADRVSKEATQVSLRGLQQLLISPIYLRYAVAFFLYVGLETGFTGWGATFLQESRNSSPAIATAAISVFWMAQSLGRLAAGLLLHPHWEKRWLFATTTAFFVFAVGLLFLAQPLGALICFGLLGYASGAIFPTMQALVNTEIGKFSGTVTGSLVGVGGIGSLLLPLLMGFLADGFGTWWAMASGTLLSLVLLAFIVPIVRSTPPAGQKMQHWLSVSEEKG